MKEQKRVPKLRFEEFSGEWEEKRLKKLFSEFKSGNGITSSSISEKGIYPVYGGNGLRGYTETFTHNGYYLLIGRQGALCGNINRSNGKSYISEHAIAGMANGENHTEFLAQRLEHYKLNRLSESSAQPGLSVAKLLRFKLIVPKLPEQQKIASFLSAVDKKITQLQQKQGLLEAYKKGVMQQIFSQGLKFTREDGSAYPDWEEKHLSDYKELEHGDGNWILSKDISEEGDYKIVQLGNIGFGNYIDKELKTISQDKFNELKGTPIYSGDLLINRMVDGSLNCCILNKVGKYVTSVDVCWIRKNNYFNNYFMMSLILYRKNQNKLLSLSSGSGRVRISKKNLFNDFEFKIPCMEEQTQIAHFLSAIDIKIAVVQTQIEKTQTFKKGLLQQLFV